MVTGDVQGKQKLAIATCRAVLRKEAGGVGRTGAMEVGGLSC